MPVPSGARAHLGCTSEDKLELKLTPVAPPWELPNLIPQEGQHTLDVIAKQPCDHFGDIAPEECWIPQRCLLNNRYWQEGGIIVLHVGGESTVGPHEMVYGMVREIAEAEHGFVIHCQHRFYGDAFPTGPARSDHTFSGEGTCSNFDQSTQGTCEASQGTWTGTFPTGLVEELPWKDYRHTHNLEQAMQDFLMVLDGVKQQLRAPKAVVVALAASFPGEMSAFMRSHFPSKIDVALASSAPLFMDLVKHDAWYGHVQKSIEAVDPACVGKVREMFRVIHEAPSAELVKPDRLGLCPNFRWEDLFPILIYRIASFAMMGDQAGLCRMVSQEPWAAAKEMLENAMPAARRWDR